MSRVLIEMIDVEKTYFRNNEEINALKKTNFIAKEAELIAIIGPSGSGKSTFLTILGGLQQPSKGKVLIEGKPFSELDIKEKSKVRFKKIGFILQASNLIPFLRVSEQLSVYNRIEKTKINQKWMKKLFKNLDVEKLKNKYPNELSGGEKQRVAISKALYHNPAVIFADEPTASLDTKKAFEVVELLRKETKEQKKATIMVTHDERLLKFCDKVYRIIDGVMEEDKNFIKN